MVSTKVLEVRIRALKGFNLAGKTRALEVSLVGPIRALEVFSQVVPTKIQEGLGLVDSIKALECFDLVDPTKALEIFNQEVRTKVPEASDLVGPIKALTIFDLVYPAS